MTSSHPTGVPDLQDRLALALERAAAVLELVREREAATEVLAHPRADDALAELLAELHRWGLV